MIIANIQELKPEKALSRAFADRARSSGFIKVKQTDKRKRGRYP